jgi:two-component system, sensor histidine kinase and response regulator
MSPTTGSPSAASRLNVLLVEDSMVQRRFAEAVLQQRNCAVQHARNGAEALDAFGSRSFDLILLDIELPVLDGFAVAAAIRQRERAAGTHTPLIALTAMADRATCLAAGVDEVLTKPLRISDLDRIFPALGSKPAGRESVADRDPAS